MTRSSSSVRPAAVSSAAADAGLVTATVPSKPLSASAVRRVFRWWGDAVVDSVLTVLFPPRCVGCGDFETYLCASCRDSLISVAPDSCPRCGEPGARALVGGRCAACMGRDLEYAGARSAFLHQGAAKRLVSEFKFGGQPVLGRLMAELALAAFTEYVDDFVPADRIFVTWVPSHRAVQRERGYNQAELLARTLVEMRPGRRESLTCGPLIAKKVSTRHQKGLDRAARQCNLRGAFTVDERMLSALGGDGHEAVLLIDDVCTTGATLSEVSRVIAAVTPRPVYAFTFSRAVSGRVEGHD